MICYRAGPLVKASSGLSRYVGVAFLWAKTYFAFKQLNVGSVLFSSQFGEGGIFVRLHSLVWEG